MNIKKLVKSLYVKILGFDIVFNPGFTITVDYSRSFQHMISSGKYKWKNPNITAEKFPVSGDGSKELKTKIFHFNPNISLEDAKSLIEKSGWEAAKMEHLLAFGAKYPEEQKLYTIVALGSISDEDGGGSVPCLGYSRQRRILFILGLEGRILFDCYFLAVR